MFKKIKALFIPTNLWYHFNMTKITCKECGTVFVVPNELKNIIKLCPECGKKSAKEAKSIFN